TLKIPSNAANDAEVEIPLQGEGLANPVVEIDPLTWDFGAAGIGSPVVTKRFGVENVGTTALHVDAAPLAGADSPSFPVETAGCEGATLEPGEECGIVIAFQPVAMGPLAATLEVASDAVGGEEAVELSGEGTAPVAAISPTSHDFGDAFVGEGEVSEE